jgi:hypothetical protein
MGELFMQDKTAREAIDKIKVRLSKIEANIDYGHLVHIPSVDQSIYLNHLSIKDALQHLINCLNITYSPDKFNHD